MKGLRRRDIAVMVVVFSAAVWLAGLMRSFLISGIAERIFPHIIPQEAEMSDSSKEAQLFTLKSGNMQLDISVTNDNKLHISQQEAAVDMKGTDDEHPNKGLYR